MIDIGLSKLALIGIAALVVIGPEKLPGVARLAGSLLGRAQRYFNEVKAEVNREIHLEELRKMENDIHAAAQAASDTLAQNVVQADKAFHAAPSLDLATHDAGIDDRAARKIRDFRRKKLVRTSAFPAWYKQRHGRKSCVMSGAARVAKYRPGSHSSPFF